MGDTEKYGDIRPITELQKGGIATVYKGLHESLGKSVLLKVLNPRFNKDEETFARFEEVAELASKIEHPNVAVLHAYGQEHGKAYVAEEFIDGTLLTDVIAMGPMPPSLAAYVLNESANALKAAHEKNLLHLEIKPSNILVTKDGKIKITDFGIASLRVGAGKVKAGKTLGYLSPEMLEDEKPVKSSDLFSLGSVFFEMLLGMPAFQGTTPDELRESVLNYDPVSFLHDDDSIPSQLRRICQQLIKKKAEQRYQDCNVLLADLNAFRKSRGQGAIANAIDMREYLADPEGIGKKLRESSVSLRTRDPRPERDEMEKEEGEVVVRERTWPAFNRTRLFVIVAVLVVVFGGLSFAGSIILSKDGSFGARNSNPNGSPGAKSPTTGAAVSRKGSGSSGGTPVQSQNSNQQRQQGPVPPSIQTPETVVIRDEDPESLIASNDSAVARMPVDDVLPDTVILISEQDQRNGKVRIFSTPSASVYLHDDSLGVTPMPLTLPPGAYTITLRHPDFPVLQTIVDVLPGRETPVDVSLWSLVGSVQVIVFPAASISLDGEYIDEAPLSRPLIVRPGTHKLTFNHPTMGVFEQTFEVKAGDKKTLQFNLTEL